MNVDVCDKKYTVVLPDKPSDKLCALRYGEEWRDCVGDNLIYFLAVELHEAREELESLRKGFDNLGKEGLKQYQELAEAKKDVEAVNWLEKQEMRWMVEAKNITDYLVWYPWIYTAWGKTYREALYKAMKQPELETATQRKEGGE